MGSEVRITLIATGFLTNSEDGSEDDELTNQLRGIKSEDELDVPSFLRRPLFSQNRQPAPETKDQPHPAARPLEIVSS